MSQIAPRLTAAQVILLAAEDLMVGGASEFSEWDLTVASWSRDRTRFGLRGYDQKHPDHKRVMMEIMGQKPQNPLTQGLMEKVRPNVYRLTPLGRAMAVRLRSGAQTPESAAASDLYRLIANLLAHPALTRWQQDPDQPRRWADAAAFLTLGGDVRRDAAACLASLRRSARAGIDWCMMHDVVYMTPAVRTAGDPIHMRQLTEIVDFLQVLEYRFPEQLAGEAVARAGR